MPETKSHYDLKTFTEKNSWNNFTRPCWLNIEHKEMSTSFKSSSSIVK